MYPFFDKGGNDDRGDFQVKFVKLNNKRCFKNCSQNKVLIQPNSVIPVQ